MTVLEPYCKLDLDIDLQTLTIENDVSILSSFIVQSHRVHMKSQQMFSKQQTIDVPALSELVIKPFEDST